METRFKSTSYFCNSQKQGLLSSDEELGIDGK
jgi:hypothetical protein